MKKQLSSLTVPFLLIGLFLSCQNKETTLVVNVSDCEGAAIQGATVELYTNNLDRIQRDSMINRGVTNNFGNVKFTGVRPVTYYFNVYTRKDTGFIDNQDDRGPNISTIEPLVPDRENTAFVQLCEEE